MSKPDKERLKNPDGIYDYFIDLYSRVGRLEGMQRILMFLSVGEISLLIFIVSKMVGG